MFQHGLCQWRRRSTASFGTTTTWAVPGSMSWLQPGQMYRFVAWNGWTRRTSRLSSPSSEGTEGPEDEQCRDDEGGGDDHVVGARRAMRAERVVSHQWHSSVSICASCCTRG